MNLLGTTVPLHLDLSIGNEPADADTMTITISDPAGVPVVDDQTVSSTEVGAYDFDYTSASHGLHRVLWKAIIGSSVVEKPDSFKVVDPARSVISLAEFKKHLNKTSTVDDDELWDFMLTASEQIEKITGRAVVRRQRVEEVDPSGGLLFLRRPVISLDDVAPPDGWPGSYDVDLLATNLDTGVVRPKPGGPWLCETVVVTYTAGYTDVPETLRMAVKELAGHLWQASQQGRTATFTRRPQLEAGDEVVWIAGYAIPRRVLELLGPFMEPVVA